MKTSRLERYKRILADEYMAQCPGVTRQEAKRRVEPRARMMLMVVSINVQGGKLTEAFRGMAPAFNQVARSMGIFANTYASEAHPPEKASPFTRAPGRVR
jgi:hypothetical protein